MAVTPVTVGDHLVARMRAAGISVVCGLPTSRLDSLLVRLSRDAGFQIVLARHEGGAGYLADGFARASGKSAAVFVAGPGATNVISAVANASVNQVPMLILTGEVAVGEFGLHSQQDTSDDGLGLGATFRRFCRCSVSIESIANARSKIDSAFRALASIPRGPVHIALPRDLVDERLPAHQLGTAAAGLGGLRTLAPCGPDVADEVIGRLDRSRAPMLVLGNGCRLDGIGEQIVAFCEKAGLPFATTPNGRGIVAETHPLSLGVLGIFGDGRADEYLFDTPCDLLIAVGVSFGGLVTRSFSPRWRGLKADVVHVDPDPSAVGRFVATSLGITTSGRAFVNALNCGMHRRGRGFLDAWHGDFHCGCARDQGDLGCPQRRTNECQRRPGQRADGSVAGRSHRRERSGGDGPRPWSGRDSGRYALRAARRCAKSVGRHRSLRPRYRDRSRDQQTRHWTGSIGHQPRVQEFIKDPARVRADTDAHDCDPQRADCPGHDRP